MNASDRDIRRWTIGLTAVVVLVLVLLGARLILIQTRLRPGLLKYREAQQTRESTMPCRRGLIVDTHGRILAGETVKPSVYADPSQVTDVARTAGRLAPLLGLTPPEIAAKITDRKHGRFVWLARKISAVQAEAVEACGLAGTGVRHEPHRFYPNGSTLGHILGFVDIDGNGLEGLELRFNDVLSGTAGRHISDCDTRRRPLWSKTAAAPTDGRHLVLTIDLVIQQFLEEALQAAVAEFQAESAVGIAQCPRSGSVLAMACHPGFDPNRPQEFSGEVRRNRCLTDPVEPGSCFKPVILAAALAEGVARLDEEVDCGQGEWIFKVGGSSRRIRDTHHNGLLTFEEVLVHSSNIGMAHLGVRLGKQRLWEHLRRFGFGACSGIELPGEARGLVPRLRDWTSYSTTSVAFGQELAVTPIQLVTAFTALVNGGTLIQPTVVRGVAGPGRRLMTRPPPQRRRIIAQGTALAVAQRAMARVVRDSHHDVKLADHEVLGKTGTAQVPYRERRGYEPGAYLGSFVGAAPARDPEIVVVVMVRKPRPELGYYGGQVAGPAVKNVIKRTLAYWNIRPSGVLEQKLTMTGGALDAVRHRPRERSDDI